MARKTRGGESKLETESDTLQTFEEGVSSKAHEFRVVGIGASAGGLEAIEQFFSNMPSDRGLAFVIVQHRDPKARSSMPEILSRFTKMPVTVASEGLKMMPNSIYLNPAGKSMDIQGGALFLREPAQTQGFRLPVDFFLRSLATEKGTNAICIILSGTGTDGTLGVKAIKEGQGTVFVQNPESAKYDGMPRSAIDTGLADFVLKPNQMPKALIDFLENTIINRPRSDTPAKEDEPFLRQIFAILRTQTGQDFSHYKGPTVRRRLQRRMSVNRINDIARYVDLLKGNEDEVEALLKDLLISVTNFFRDPDAFKALKIQLKKSLKNKAEGSDLRAWVTGCATGEEAYSVAIVISECLSELGKRLRVQVYATDVAIDVIGAARAGKYSTNIAADVTQERLERFFTNKDGIYTVNKEIRGKVVFAPQNIIKDPPFSRMDLICCRNLLIYLDSDAQKRLLPLLHYAIRPGGLLFLGSSETIGEASDLFTVVDKKWKIYQRREVAVGGDRLKFPAASSLSPREPVDALARGMNEAEIPGRAEKVILDNYSPTFAIIDEKHRPVYVRGRTGKYLEIASGQPTWSILEMAREGLKTELASAIFQATSENKLIVRERLNVKTDGGFEGVTLKVAPFAEPGIPPGYLIIIFQEMGPGGDVTIKPSGTGRKLVAELEEELGIIRESHQATIEELEAANEELKSANEELQSNNEELDTSSEELQSLNEELSTLNSELQDKNELLNKANDDLNNFLNRTDIAIVLLDSELNIRSYTPATSEIFNVRKIDIGRPLIEITTRLLNKQVVEDAREVLRTIQPKEIEVQREDGHWYSLRISSFRTAQNVISGLVMSLVDINEQKKDAQALRETRDYLDNLVNFANGPIIVWDEGLKITRFNHAFEKLTGRSASEMLGQEVDILFPADMRPDVLQKIHHITTQGQRWEEVEIPIQHIDGAIRIVLWNSATLFDTDGKTPVTTIAQGQDITARTKAEEELKARTAELVATNNKLESANNELEAFGYSVAHDLRQPLRGMEGFSEAILEDYGDKLDAKGKEYLNFIRESSLHMSELIDDLLRLSRLSRAEMHAETVDLSDLAQAIVESLKKRQPERKAEFVISPGMLVTADRQLLNGALRNLLENAWKFTGKGSHTYIEMGVKQTDGEKVYFIKDNGIGFDMQYSDKLFQPFQRLHSSEEYEGTGIGLAIVQRIIRRHGGRIWAESAKGVGSTFYFTLDKTS